MKIRNFIRKMNILNVIRNVKAKNENPVPKSAVAAMIAVALALTAALSYTIAEYTKSSRAKRVVASVDASDALFSSNFLMRSGGIENEVNARRTLYTSDESNPVVARVAICNYAQGNPTKFYSYNVEYTLTAKIVTVSNGIMTAVSPGTDIGGRTVNIVPVGNESNAFTLSSSAPTHVFPASTLGNLEANSDLYHVTLSSEFNAVGGIYYLYLSAEPSLSRPDIFRLDCLFDTAVSREQQEITWEGYFNESGALGDTAGASPDNYDGFRYVVTGAGAGTVTLSWDPAMFDISQIFLLNVSATPATDTDTGWQYIEFSVDSDVTNRYDLQFYYAPGVAGTITDWDDINGGVSFRYVVSDAGDGE